MKAGLVPLHFWMPLAYDAAPIPAAAVMSGAVVKASILALIRFLPLDTALPEALSPAALWAALWPVLVGGAIALGLDSLGRQLPRIPAGDLGIALGRLAGLALAAGRGFETIDAFARRWAVASIAMLVVSLLFGCALMALG